MVKEQKPEESGGGATMRRGTSVIMLLGIFAVEGRGADPVIYPSNPSVNRGWVTTATAWSQPVVAQQDVRKMGGKGAAKRDAGAGTHGSCATCGEGCGEGGRSNKLQRLIDFLLYRPSVPCDCCPKTTQYVPPLYMWNPNYCHANLGNSCTPVCTKNRGMKREKAGCATCGNAAGVPM